jgi:hypothetical protein
MARLGRLERPTSCFGGTRSIQLSYSRVVPLYHAARLRAFRGVVFDGVAAEVQNPREWIASPRSNYLVLSF